MERPALELADIFRRHGPAYRQAHRLPRPHLRVMRAIETCRTAALGGHVEQCDHCQHTRISYNSCRNRHCPKCQSAARAEWLEGRQAELLPVEYFHVVFAADPRHLGAGIGFFGILHTWGQNLLDHPHLHCVVPGGGLSTDHERWIGCRPGFFLPVRVLSRLFRRLFLEALQTAFDQGQLQFFGDRQPLADPAAFARHLAPLGKAEWVVYAKPPFGGPPQVLEYLGRYTHRVAISNQRLLALDEDQVSFQWKDYRHHNRSKVMRVSADEFIRRFLLHVLPPQFRRIRHFGFLANCHRRDKLALCRRLLARPLADVLPAPEDCRRLAALLSAESLGRCPQCGIGHMIRIQTVPAYRWPATPPDSS